MNVTYYGILQKFLDMEKSDHMRSRRRRERQYFSHTNVLRYQDFEGLINLSPPALIDAKPVQYPLHTLQAFGCSLFPNTML